MFTIASNHKYDGYQCRLPLMIYKFFNKKSAGYNHSTSGNNNGNQQLANELHKPIITKHKIHKFCSSFKDDIWGESLAGIQLVSKYYKGLRFLLCIIHLYSMIRLFHWKIRKVQLFLVHFKVFQIIRKEKETNCRLIKTVNSLLMRLKHS